MLLDRYDFYDLYAVLVAIRFNPQAKYNIEIVKTIISVLEKQEETTVVEQNIIRNVLKSMILIISTALFMKPIML